MKFYLFINQAIAPFVFQNISYETFYSSTYPFLMRFLIGNHYMIPLNIVFGRVYYSISLSNHAVKYKNYYLTILVLQNYFIKDFRINMYFQVKLHYIGSYFIF